MRPDRTRSTVRLHLLISVAIMVACAGGSSPGGCGGCSCLSPLAKDYDGVRLDDAVSLRVSQDGFSYINGNWAKLIGAFTTNPIGIDVPCSYNQGYICDQNHNNQCDPGEHCTINVKITDVKLTPVPINGNQSAEIDGTARLQIATGDIRFTRELCFIFCCTLKCHANFDSARSGTGYETFDVPIDFSVDRKWGNLTRIDIGNITGIDQLDSGDLVVGQDGGICSSIVCGVADIGFIKGFLVDQFVKPALKKQVADQAQKATCRGCSSGASCSAGPLENSCCPGGSSCSSSLCKDSAGGKCLPKMFGIQGAVETSTLLASLGAPPLGAGPKVPLFAAIGSSVHSDTGLTMGVIAGSQATSFAACVGDLPPPILRTLPVPDFDALAPAGYHVGFAITKDFIENLAYEIHRAGGMCLSVGTRTADILNTGTLKTLLPSLDLLTGGVQDAAMFVALRPTKVPTVVVGEGTYDPVTRKPLKPLLTLSLTDVVVDFYAYLEDRYVRLFSMSFDFSLPLSLIVEGGCAGTATAQSVTVALGDMKSLITKLKTFNSELLAEDPAILQQLIPLVIGVAEPQLARAIKPINMPDVNGLLIKIAALKGVTPTAANPDQYEHLAGFAQLRMKGGVCASFQPRTSARLFESRMPTAAALHPGAGKPLPWPAALIDVEASSGGAPVEYAYRVDGGFWSTWFDGPRLTVEHPRFLLQGVHEIEIRAQLRGDPDTIEQTPARVAFVVDYAGPTIVLHEDRRRGLLTVEGRDAVTASENIQFAYRLGDEQREGSYGRSRPVDIAAVERAGGTVEIFARDELGNVSSKVWRTPVAHLGAPVAGSGDIETATGVAPSSGCSVAGGTGLWSLAGLLVFLRRRRSR